MTNFIEGPQIAAEDRFPGLAELLEDLLTPQLAQHVDPFDADQAMAMYIEKLALDMPIEVQELLDDDNQFSLGTSPPTQWIETSVQPVWHRVSVTLELDNAETRNQILES